LKPITSPFVKGRGRAGDAEMTPSPAAQAAQTPSSTAQEEAKLKVLSAADKFVDRLVSLHREQPTLSTLESKNVGTTRIEVVKGLKNRGPGKLLDGLVVRDPFVPWEGRSSADVVPALFVLCVL
jgi:hypothetical protein